MGFSLGAFARGLGTGYQTGSRLATERQQRRLTQLNIEELEALKAEKDQLGPLVSQFTFEDEPPPPAALPLDEQEEGFVGPSVTKKAKAEVTESFSDRYNKLIAESGLSLQGKQASLDYLKQQAQSRLNALGMDAMQAAADMDIDRLNSILTQASRITPGKPQQVTLPDVDPKTGKPWTDVHLAARVQSALGGLSDFLDTRLKLDEADRAERQVAVSEAAQETAAAAQLTNEKRTNALTDYYKAISTKAYADAEETIAGIGFDIAAINGLDPKFVTRVRDEINEAFLDSDTLASLDAELRAPVKGLMYDIMSAPGQFGEIPAETAGQAAIALIQQAESKKDFELDMTNNGYAVFKMGNKNIFINPNTIEMLMPGKIEIEGDGAPQATSPPEALPTTATPTESQPSRFRTKFLGRGPYGIPVPLPKNPSPYLPYSFFDDEQQVPYPSPTDLYRR